jgi:hypothetical protein
VALRLQNPQAEEGVLTGNRLGVVFGVTLFTAAASNVWTRPAADPVSYPRPATLSSVPPDVSGAALIEEPRQQPVDLYGNEVTNAIAKYSLDSSGALYEEHAPDVELPQLGIPKS